MTGGGADDDPDGAAVYALRADGDDSNGAGRKRREREHADDRWAAMLHLTLDGARDLWEALSQAASVEAILACMMK